MKTKPVVLFKSLVSLGLLTLVFTQIDLNQIWSRTQYLSIPFVLFALIYYAACQWLSCLRWQNILSSVGYSIPLLSLLRGYFAGMFVSIFLPGSFGRDVYRMYRVGRQIRDPAFTVLDWILSLPGAVVFLLDSTRSPPKHA